MTTTRRAVLTHTFGMAGLATATTLASSPTAGATTGRPRGGDLMPTTVEATFDERNGITDVAVGPDGTVYAAVGASEVDQQGLYRLTVRGQLDRLTTTTVSTLAMDDAGRLYATVTDRSDPSAPRGTLARVAGDGRMTTAAVFPQGAMVNGIDATRPDSVYAADAQNGSIYRAAPSTGAVQTWLQDDRLLPDTAREGIPGLNGIRSHRGAVYTFNSSRQQYWRIPVETGGRAGAPELVSEGLSGDDFDIDIDGTTYFATHPNNTVIALSPDGTTTTVVGDASTGIIGATSAEFGVRNGTRRLFVVGDGGYFASQLTDEQLEDFPPTTREDFSVPFILSMDTSRRRRP
ncbi:MAG: hypothetical protein ACRCSN_05490 [Dermatophilaceae bacterium]